jgi:hypothetical protein
VRPRLGSLLAQPGLPCHLAGTCPQPVSQRPRTSVDNILTGRPCVDALRPQCPRLCRYPSDTCSRCESQSEYYRSVAARGALICTRWQRCGTTVAARLCCSATRQTAPPRLAARGPSQLSSLFYFSKSNHYCCLLASQTLNYLSP